jgi:hypothetical protein
MHSQVIIIYSHDSPAGPGLQFLVYFQSNHSYWPAKLEVTFDRFSISLELFTPVFHLYLDEAASPYIANYLYSTSLFWKKSDKEFILSTPIIQII